MSDVVEILRTGLGVSVQDQGRHGWKRFGVPPSGVMDPHAAMWANRLVGNPETAPVLELLMQGAELRVLEPRRFAVTGAEAGAMIPAWHARRLRPGDVLRFPYSRNGLWTYVAVEGGFQAPVILGSASTYARGGIGRELRPGDRLQAGDAPHARGLDEAWVYPGDRRSYEEMPLIRVWRGPQWDWFEHVEHAGFFAADWEVSNRSDRVGYRLEGARMNPPAAEMQSEPVVVGSIQVPPNGQPIVTMRDGPTVGGYPKIAIVDPDSLTWLAQCRPGVKFRMALME